MTQFKPIHLLLLGGCATPLPTAVDRPRSEALAADPNTRLGRLYGPETTCHSARTGLYTMGHAIDGFAARMALTRMAERSIDA